MDKRWPVLVMVLSGVSCGGNGGSQPIAAEPTVTPATAGAPASSSAAGTAAPTTSTPASSTPASMPAMPAMPASTPPASAPKPAANGGMAGQAAGMDVPPTADPGMNMPPATQPTTPTLFYLNNLGGVLRAGDDGKNAKTIVPAVSAGSGQDGIAVDVKAGHVFWTNMGAPSSDDGTIMRSDLDGKNVMTIVRSGGTFTPKQLKLDAQNSKLYWSDREGMRVMRANLDGSMIETLVSTGNGDADRRDASRWCVGIAVDVKAGKLYWTQKGGDNAHQGTIKRAALELPAGQDPAKRTDIEVLFANLPEPIDLDIDYDKRMLYWTDRGDNTVSRAPLDPPAVDPAMRKDREILVKGLGEAIGVALDPGRNRMFYTSLTGVVGTSALDGSMARELLSGQGTLTGIALAELPK